MMFLDIIWDIRGALRSLIASITELIYKLIAGLYNLFIALSQISLFKNNEIETIYKRVEVILAVIMVFYVSFQFVKYIVNPETFSDKEKGVPGLIKKMVIVVFLMGFGTSIFATADKIRNTIITKQVLPQLIFQDRANNNYSQDTAGYNFSSQMIRLFYTANPDVKDEKCDNNHTAAQTVELQLSNFANGNDLQLSFCTGKYVQKDVFLWGLIGRDFQWLVNLEWLYAILVGGFIVWVLINYCVEAAKIVFQLALLEIIAPIPIISYLSPDKDGMFQKWGKQVLTTYLDLIVRLFIIYLMMYFCDLALKAFNNINEILETSVSGDFMQMLVKIFLIIGLLYFAMQAPKLIKELLPKGMAGLSGNFGFGAKSAKERFNPSARLAGAQLGRARRGIDGARRTFRKAKANADKYGSLLSPEGRQNRKNAKIVASAEKRAARQQRKIDRDNAKEELKAARTAYGAELAKQAENIKNGKQAKNTMTKPEFTETDKNNLENKRSRLKELDNLAAKGTLSEADRRERMALRKEVGNLEVKQIMASAEGGVALSSAALSALKFKNDANVRFQDAEQKIAAAQATLDSHTATPEQKDKAQNDKKAAQAAKAQAEKDISNADNELNKSKNVSGYVSAIEGVKSSKQELASSRAALEAQKEICAKTEIDPKATKADKDAALAALKKCQEDVATKESALTSSQEALAKASEPFKTTVNGTKLSKNEMSEMSERLKENRAAVEAAQGKKVEAQDAYNKSLHEALETWNGGAVGTAAKETFMNVGIPMITGTTLGPGAIKDMIHGAKTKEINKVIPNFVNDIKQDVQIEAKRAEWVAQGGNDTIVENISRNVDNIGTKYFGIASESQKLSNSLKPLEVEIETNKNATGKIDEVSKSVSSLKENATKLRESGKFSIKLNNAGNEKYRDRVLDVLKTTVENNDGGYFTLHEILEQNGKTIKDFADTKALTEWVKGKATGALEYANEIDSSSATREAKDEARRKSDEWASLSAKLVSDISKRDISRYAEIRDSANLEQLAVVGGQADIYAGIDTMRQYVQTMLNNNSVYNAVRESKKCMEIFSKYGLSESDLISIRNGDWSRLPNNYLFFDDLAEQLKYVKKDYDTAASRINQQIQERKDAIRDMKVQEERPGGSSSGDSGKK